MSKFQSAENFARERHSGKIGMDGNSPYHEHLAGVVARLKNIGITDEDVLSAAWLHDIIGNTETLFDEVDQRFGSKIAVLVLAVSKDKRLPRSRQEEQYVKQLKNSSFEAKIIKLCDISANLRDLSILSSNSKKIRAIKREIFYLNAIKSDLIKNKSQFPGITSLINGINDVIMLHGLRPIIL